MQKIAHGKFLLTGEYLVLKGAKSLALPLKYGQSMQVEESGNLHCKWESLQNGNSWFHAQFDQDLRLMQTNDAEVAQKLEEIFENILLQNPNAKELFVGKSFRFDTDFPRNWGLGTSSTLVALLADYAQCNPYQILEKSFGGSGYDLACAFAQGPIFYTRNGYNPIVENAPFNPSFADKIYFVYLGQKQNSAKEVKKFFKEAQIHPEDLQKISHLSEAFCLAQNVQELMQAMKEHEQIMSRILNTKTVQELHFADFDGAVKSMGAWGGDFVMVASDNEPNKVKEYFLNKGFVTILGYSNVL